MKRLKPKTPGQRFAVIDDAPDITKKRPEKRLTEPLPRSGGRNNSGRLTVRYRGGGHRRKYRIIDFKRDKRDIPAKVSAIEYDPNRSARIALLTYADGEKRYILAPHKLRVGDRVICGEKVDVAPGNATILQRIPEGTEIHNIELRPGKGGQLVRSAGAAAKLMDKEGGMARVMLPSGTIRLIHLDCMATIGQVGNVEHENLKQGKAGRNRWRGIRPHVQGTAKNPIDHPHGGGEGHKSAGRHPVSPWGKLTKGYRTRRAKRTDKYHIRRGRRR